MFKPGDTVRLLAIEPWVPCCSPSKNIFDTIQAGALGTVVSHSFEIVHVRFYKNPLTNLYFDCWSDNKTLYTQPVACILATIKIASAPVPIPRWKRLAEI